MRKLTYAESLKVALTTLPTDKWVHYQKSISFLKKCGYQGLGWKEMNKEVWRIS